MINYDIIKQLAQQQGISVTELCALAPKNDPFYTGRPAEVIAATWFTEMWQHFGYSRGVHLRRVHYQVQAQDPPIKLPSPLSWKEKGTGRQLTTDVYINNDRCWEFLSEAGKWARYLQLVPASAFVQPRIDAYKQRLDAIKQQGAKVYGTLFEALGQADVDLADYPLPDPELPDEPATLYDSSRDYLDQLMAYKAQRHGPNGHAHD